MKHVPKHRNPLNEIKALENHAHLAPHLPDLLRAGFRRIHPIELDPSFRRLYQPVDAAKKSAFPAPLGPMIAINSPRFT